MCRSWPGVPKVSVFRCLTLVACLQTAGCSFQDDLTPHEWVPFEAIGGALRPDMGNPAAPPQQPNPTLRVVTYNIHLGPDIPGLAAEIQKNSALSRADVFFFEEIESHPADGKTQAAWLAGLLGMNYAYAPAWAYPDGGTHGLAVLSRFPVGGAQVLQLPHFDLVTGSEPRIAIRMTVTVGAQALPVVVVHLDTRINVNQRLQQLEPAIQGAAPTSILGGDFNSNPYIWADRVLPLLPQEAAAPIDTAAAIDQLMSSYGFAAPTSGSGITTNAISNARLDSIYTRGYIPMGFGVERSVTISDHYPVWADIAWPPQ